MQSSSRESSKVRDSLREMHVLCNASSHASGERERERERRVLTFEFIYFTTRAFECIPREASLGHPPSFGLKSGVRSAGLNFVQQVCPGCLQLLGPSDWRIRPMIDIRMPG